MNHDDLRAKALAATPHLKTERVHGAVPPTWCVWNMTEADAAFTTAANPQVVLGLLDEIERLRREKECLRVDFVSLQKVYGALLESKR